MFLTKAEWLPQNTELVTDSPFVVCLSPIHTSSDVSHRRRQTRTGEFLLSKKGNAMQINYQYMIKAIAAARQNSELSKLIEANQSTIDLVLNKLEEEGIDIWEKSNGEFVVEKDKKVISDESLFYTLDEALIFVTEHLLNKKQVAP